VQAALQALHPVGSIYINATDSTNPGTLLGFGTWSAFGAGRVPVGFDSSNALFDAAEETGGSADAVVVSHTHTATSTSVVTDAGHRHTVGTADDTNTGPGGTISNNTNSVTSNINTTLVTTGVTVATATTNASTGVSGTNANLPPYITVFMWKRSA
jgi:hypothetical protein